MANASKTARRWEESERGGEQSPGGMLSQRYLYRYTRILIDTYLGTEWQISSLSPPACYLSDRLASHAPLINMRIFEPMARPIPVPSNNHFRGFMKPLTYN